MSYNPFEELISRLERIERMLDAPEVNVSTIAAPKPPSEIINTETLCARLDISEPTIIRMRKRKAIPFLQIGSAIRYDWRAVIEALEQKKHK